MGLIVVLTTQVEAKLYDSSHCFPDHLNTSMSQLTLVQKLTTWVSVIIFEELMIEQKLGYRYE